MYISLNHLQSHRRQHNKDKPYKCHHCNRGYVDAASLEVHLSTHTVKHAKLYSCGLCNRTYTSVHIHFTQSHTTFLYTLYHKIIFIFISLFVFNLQETYLMKHMHKHAPDLVQSPLGSTHPSQSPGHAGGEDSDEDAQSRAERSNSFSPTIGVPCVFDLNPYKPVTSADVQYKTVSMSDISPHKDLCITVEASAIQVEHLNS